MVGVLQGEGLVNAAAALVIYGYAITAAATGAFALASAAGSFVVVALGGIAVGFAVVWTVERSALVLREYDLGDSLIDSLSSSGAAYAECLAGQALTVSGVPATVVAGILVSRRSSVIYTPESRLLAVNFWRLWIYLLNAFVFLAIGLQLRALVEGGTRWQALLPAALGVSLVLIVVRLAWVAAATLISRWVAVRKRGPVRPWAWAARIVWTGVRGHG